MPSDADTLAGLLRAWRGRLLPADVGMESYGRRRTAGLRREELAQLAGVSVDYVMRLEQGRSRTPSAQIVTALARALQLDRTETEMFYRAAGLAPPGAGTVSHHIPSGVQRMLARMSDLPLAVFAADWTLLHSTPLWRALFGAPSVLSDPSQNLIVQTFVENSIADIATAHGGPDIFERALVADLRRSAAILTGDTHFQTFIAQVREQSPRFAALWNEGRAAAHQSMVKTVHSPLVGDVTLDCDVVTVPDSDIKLVVYSATESSPDAAKLDFLRVRAVHSQIPADR
ncbi:helix-turn-helix protein [Glaciihabitans tibetensis]|uniref:Helix-turn-helix protein n=1 Tax=Glaciihabitans tibetensis TaxID=1266600 RepID=A0A2T0VDX6_9MICO|nr:helix-turn-helix transcriptional regulator [Glaciihabitans tibetensis]PRY68361.1 helix-turn-helix protein [Glaciihabitans tibetensis]